MSTDPGQIAHRRCVDLAHAALVISLSGYPLLLLLAATADIPDRVAMCFLFGAPSLGIVGGVVSLRVHSASFCRLPRPRCAVPSLVLGALQIVFWTLLALQVHC